MLMHGGFIPTSERLVTYCTYCTTEFAKNFAHPGSPVQSRKVLAKPNLHGDRYLTTAADEEPQLLLLLPQLLAGGIGGVAP
jgi:hypothetical protein